MILCYMPRQTGKTLTRKILSMHFALRLMNQNIPVDLAYYSAIYRNPVWKRLSSAMMITRGKSHTYTRTLSVAGLMLTIGKPRGIIVYGKN